MLISNRGRQRVMCVCVHYRASAQQSAHEGCDGGGVLARTKDREDLNRAISEK